MQVKTTKKKFIKKIVYNLKVFAPLPKFVVYKQEINLIFFKQLYA